MGQASQSETPPRALGPKRHNRRVLTIAERNRMIAILYDAGCTMEQVADFTRENVSAMTVSRAVASAV